MNSSPNDMRVGFYEVNYPNSVEEDIEILDVLRGIENANFGYITNIEMELYPVTGNYFKINGKTIHAFNGRYSSPPELKITSLSIKPASYNTNFTIIYYYYL